MATTTFSPVPATADQLANMSRELVAVGDRLEQKGSDDWFVVARAAALLDGLRHGVATVSGGGCEARP